MPDRQLEFVYLSLFERTRKNVLTDEEMRAVETRLLADPMAGAIMADTGGVRKLRAAQENRGKSGSARVVYYFKSKRETVYFIIAFAKNMQGNLTAAQRSVMRAVVAEIEGEEWPARRRGSQVESNS